MNKSKTVQLYKTLTQSGYEAKVTNTYSNAYNQDYRHISLSVKVEVDRMSEFYNETRHFEVLLKSTDGEIFFEVRKERRYAELIEIESLNYDTLERRETTPLDEVTIYTNKDWEIFIN